MADQAEGRRGGRRGGRSPCPAAVRAASRNTHTARGFSRVSWTERCGQGTGTSCGTRMCSPRSPFAARRRRAARAAGCLRRAQRRGAMRSGRCRARASFARRCGAPTPPRMQESTMTGSCSASLRTTRRKTVERKLGFMPARGARESRLRRGGRAGAPRSVLARTATVGVGDGGGGVAWRACVRPEVGERSGPRARPACGCVCVWGGGGRGGRRGSVGGRRGSREFGCVRHDARWGRGREREQGAGRGGGDGGGRPGSLHLGWRGGGGAWGRVVRSGRIGPHQAQRAAKVRNSCSR